MAREYKGYKSGDWLKSDSSHYHKIDIFFGEDVIFEDGDWDFKSNLNCYSKVTEQWKIILLESGRKTPEFKPNDVIVTHQDLYLAGYHDHDEIVLLFEENLVIRFCPEEHSVEV